MKCPVCGYENDPDDVECIACGSDMALSAESIAIEKRRSEEAMQRYHQQQKELRRELGIDEPEEEPLVMEGGGDDASLAGQAETFEPPLEMETLPSDFHSDGLLCPQCGHRNGAGSVECARCGVIFSKLKDAPGNGNRAAAGLQPRGIHLDSPPHGPEAAPAPNRQGTMQDDLGECVQDSASGYSPYVREVKTDPWAGAKAVGARAKAAWERADVAAKGAAVLKKIRGLGQWLKGVRPRWYGAALCVILVLALLPFAYKGGVSLKAAWDKRARVKHETALVEAFTQDNVAIRAEIRSLANGHKFNEARAALQRYDIPPLKKKIAALERYLEEKETYARVLAVPAWKFETNYTLFSRLVDLNPESELYRSKQSLYKKRLADQCYDKALKIYRGQKNDAALSAKAVALIEQAVGFYPANRDYKTLRSKVIRGDLLYYKGNGSLQMALRDEGRGKKAAYAKQRKITIWLRNTSDETLYINPEFFTLETRNGKRIKYNNMMATGLQGKLGPGEKTAGVLYFRTLAMPRRLVFDHLVVGTVQREFP